MKLSDIVLHLGQYLPRYTSKFSETLSYSSLTADNGVVTVVTSSNHGLTTGDYISVHGMHGKRDVTSLTQEDGLATCVVDSDHDLTEGWQETVTLEGADQSVYNDTHELEDVPNRRTFTFEVDSGSVSPATGSIKFVEYLERGFDGAYQINVVNSTTFTFEVADQTLSLQGFNGTIARGQRIMGATSIDRFLELYEQRSDTDDGKYWMVVALEDAVTSKNRQVMSDAHNVVSASVDIRMQLIEPFTVFVVGPSKTNVAAVDVIDDCVEEIRNALFKSLFGYRFDTGLANSADSGVVMIGHGQAGYTKAYYVHYYRFETMKEVTIDDSIYKDNAHSPTRAFRDIDLRINNEYREQVMQTMINLDDDPL